MRAFALKVLENEAFGAQDKTITSHEIAMTFALTSRLSLARRALTTALSALALSASGQAMAEDRYPFADLPESFVGMMNGNLQPKSTLRPYVGSAQTAPSVSGGGTGRQVYFGGWRYRGQGDWQLGWNTSIYDDPPAAAIHGRTENITQLSMGLDFKYQLMQTERLSASVFAGGEFNYYRSGAALAAGDKPQFFSGTLSLPVTYQLSDDLWVSGEVGYTHAGKTVEGETGFGGRAFASVGAAYRLSDRIFTYGSAKVLKRGISNGIDAQDQGGKSYLYTLGGQYTLTPQSAINVYVTNAYSPLPVGDDWLFYPDKVNPVFGLLLTYIPSGKGVGETATTFRPATRSEPVEKRFSDGFTITSPHTLASDRFHARLSYGAQGQKELALFHTIDPDFQFELAFEDFALGTGSNFRNETAEDTRFFVGGRWQAMDEAYGHPFSLGFRVFAGRDIKKPTVGVIYAEGSASKRFGDAEFTVNPRLAAFGKELRAGLGLGVSYDFTDSLTAIAELTPLRGDKPVWAFGIRKSFEQAPFTLDLYTTNAAGLNGIGSLLSNDKPQIGVSIHWETGFDWL